MIILSHRGYWKNEAEKNQKKAFDRSFSLGFGTETDIRDFNGQLVISHDIATEASMTIDEFFDIYKKYDDHLYLALNIKADGLQTKLKESIKHYNITNYFVFDMSIPDGINYIRHGINTFTRESEYEVTPAFYEDASGIWLDAFNHNWFDKELIAKHIANDKQICIVSPELHKRNHLDAWQTYKNIENQLGISNLMICTDFPEQAKEFFDA